MFAFRDCRQVHVYKKRKHSDPPSCLDTADILPLEMMDDSVFGDIDQLDLREIDAQLICDSSPYVKQEICSPSSALPASSSLSSAAAAAATSVPAAAGISQRLDDEIEAADCSSSLRWFPYQLDQECRLCDEHGSEL